MDLASIKQELEARIAYLAEDAAHNDSYRLYMFFKMTGEVIEFYNNFFGLDLFDAFSPLIAAQNNLPDALVFSALELKYRGMPAAAGVLLDRASNLDCSRPYIRALAADLLREQGLRSAARARSLSLLKEIPGLTDADTCLTMCDVDELLASPYDYYQILDKAHTMLQPKRYIEIGVSTGKSLALARSGTKAIGVDPNAGNRTNHFFHSPETTPTLFAMTSNDFFRDVPLASVFGETTFEMAFIDGLHVFEQALMDFIHLESRATKDSVIFIHDCLPVNTIIAERERQTGFWTGDVWRVIACLKTLRPDLDIITFPASPSGLAMVTGLNPASRVLASQFDTIVAHFIAMPLPESFAERCDLLNVTREDPIEVLSKRCIPTRA